MKASPGNRPFDPGRPLPGPPDPWAPSSVPEARPGPPYLMTEMIAAESAFAGRLLARLGASKAPAALAQALRETATAGRPIVLTGCGTSEHAAQAATEILRDAFRAAGLPTVGLSSSQAFESSLDPPTDGIIIAISHEGGTAATNRALEAARAAGAQTAIITCSSTSPGADLADIVVETGELDQSWCHTIGYLSPILAAATVSDVLRRSPPDQQALRAALLVTAAIEDEASSLAAQLAQCRTLTIIASGADRPAARELALKLEEAAHLPTVMRDLETLLHGHLPALDDSTGLVLLLLDRHGRPERTRRARGMLAAAGSIGIRCGAILAASVAGAISADAIPAGRILAPDLEEEPAAPAAIVGAVIPLQLLAERIARARGMNPDLLRRDDPAYRRAAEAADLAGIGSGRLSPGGTYRPGGRSSRGHAGSTTGT